MPSVSNPLRPVAGGRFASASIAYGQTHTVIAPVENWMDALTFARDNRRMMPPRPPLTAIRLSDHFGQYVFTLNCECGHTRTARPQTLAALAGWDALLADVVGRLRCTHCGRQLCSVSVRPETKRDG